MTIFTTRLVRTFFHYLAAIILKIIGWKVVDKRPADRKFIMLGAPHTSNWDFFLLLLFAFHQRTDVRWMGKKQLFPFPFRHFMIWLGGIPIDRSKNNNMVDQVAEVFKASDQLIVVIPPEGTRKKVQRWRTGFYYIARKAEVPVSMSYLDYGEKEMGYGPLREMGDDIEKELADLKVYYSKKTPRHPELF